MRARKSEVPLPLLLVCLPVLLLLHAHDQATWLSVHLMLSYQDLSSRSRRQGRRPRGFCSSTPSRRSADHHIPVRAELICQVILHSTAAQLESLADHSWSPLFAQDSTTSSSDIGEDSARNVKAACIGKLTTAAPHKFLPELQSLLSSSPRDRALVAAAVRYTFIDTSSSYDELIAPVIVDFLSLVHDENVVSSYQRHVSLANVCRSSGDYHWLH